MTAKLLFVGDVHLGRVPARVPETLAEYGHTPRACGPAAAWEATVDHALAQRPDAVVFAGDLVESDHARFEAYHTLDHGVQQLVKAGIPVCGVAGNHDVEALPRLARAIPGFRLLGADGHWEVFTVTRDGVPLVDIAGRSFTRAHERAELPLGGFPAPRDGRPLLGVAHCDLDQSGSKYAPVKRRDLAATGAAGWFLGHVHKPSLAPDPRPPDPRPPDPRPIGYLGALVGLDPTDTGRRGPWWVEVSPEGAIRLEHLPLAPIRWESLEAELPADADDVLEHLKHAVEDRAAAIIEADGDFAVLGCRLRLAGRVRAHGDLVGEIGQINQTRPVLALDRRWAFVDRLVDDLAPDLDLAELARGQDPPGLLAADLLALESADLRGAELIAAGRAALDEAAGAPAFRSCSAWDQSDAAVRDQLIRAGRRALEAMLDEPQRGDTAP